ncbi:CYP10 [Symbiodinium sp. CCMP2592]|nr:CYP10 [Symbiodinium sp. CCMP2592]
MNERVVEWADEGRYLIRQAETLRSDAELPASSQKAKGLSKYRLSDDSDSSSGLKLKRVPGQDAQKARRLDSRLRDPLLSAREMSLTIKTNLGPLKVELFCAQAPKSCKNFLALAASGYYDNTNFHRNIKGFMIQGGDPTGTGKGGQSIYGGYFEDEFVSTLKHERRGCLSMVNTGPNTNGSQFFVTYSRQPHLNGVYTTFGRLIDGLDTLDKMEKEPINAKNRPMRPIKIESIVIHANPIADEEAQQ